MDAQRITIARTCLDAAYDGTLAFPEIAATLIRSGFDGYVVDYRGNTTTFFLPDGDSIKQENRPSDGTVAAEFDRVGIASQVRWVQANPPGYSYADFCRTMKAFGCAGYRVSFPGRQVLYFGLTAETHVEHFPQ